MQGTNPISIGNDHLRGARCDLHKWCNGKVSRVRESNWEHLSQPPEMIFLESVTGVRVLRNAIIISRQNSLQRTFPQKLIAPICCCCDTYYFLISMIHAIILIVKHNLWHTAFVSIKLFLLMRLFNHLQPTKYIRMYIYTAYMYVRTHTHSNRNPFKRISNRNITCYK